MTPRYYHTTVGQDHIPDQTRWLDTAIPYALIAFGLGLWALVIARTLGWI